MKRRHFLAGFGATLAAPAVLRAAPNQGLKFGVLTDMTGIFSDGTGKGSVTGAQLAIEDFGRNVLGQPVELVFGDHQNKPDVGGNIAREWYERDGVDVILDVPGFLDWHRCPDFRAPAQQNVHYLGGRFR